MDMERQKGRVNIEKQYPVARIPEDFADRLRLEGVKSLSVNIDDEKRIIVIRPIEDEKEAPCAT